MQESRISVRIPADVKQSLQDYGFNISELARTALINILEVYQIGEMSELENELDKCKQQMIDVHTRMLYIEKRIAEMNLIEN